MTLVGVLLARVASPAETLHHVLSAAVSDAGGGGDSSRSVRVDGRRLGDVDRRAAGAGGPPEPSVLPRWHLRHRLATVGDGPIQVLTVDYMDTKF